MGLPKTWITNELLTSSDLNAQFAYCNALVPVGAILAFDDHDGTVTFDTDIYAYNNGQTISDAGSPLNGKVLTDMSNRYLVGFGTEAGGDIGTAAWSGAPVGNANNQVNLQHLHSETVHYHPMPHNHNSGSLQFKTFNSQGSSLAYFMIGYDASGGDLSMYNHSNSYKAGTGLTMSLPILNTQSARQYYTKDGTGSTGSVSTANTSNSAAANTGNSLSTTQSIQPRSKQVRFITRYK